MRAAAAVLSLVALFAAPPGAADEERCLDCHRGIEDMHPALPLGCVDCHGGNPKGRTKEEAHVVAVRSVPGDERVLPKAFEPALLRFRNPTDLRVAKDACGRCHAEEVDHLLESLHGTTAGHLSDGFYEYGLHAEKEPRYGIFAAADTDGDVPKERGALFRVEALPEPGVGSDGKTSRDLRAHYTDLPRKACMRCHLWSEGTGLRGRLGQDGDYRAQGCAACHVPYADDGLSRTGDPTVDRFEPGHPLRHAMTRRVPTEACTRCHNGDASIGLNFRGLGQLVPGMPAGPDVPGTTASRLHGTFHVNDPAVTPPDLHHERGMHCVDCHTVRDVMGDGNLYGHMEHAVEIECETCHGTFAAGATGRTERGHLVSNLRREGERFVLKSKVTGRDHPVKQAKDVITPGHADFNPRAAAAMRSEHARLECYACHNAWNPLFFGFHFDRNESFSQLDTLAGERTPGRVSTLEKLFGTYRGLLLGVNTEGRVAPFLVGFAAMATVRGKDGETVIDQEMPVTRAGLSGMTLIHHQMHTNRAEARACAECHRSPQAAGAGSGAGIFELTRRFGVAANEKGISVFRYDRESPGDSAPVATVAIAGAASAVALRCDDLQGHAEVAYAAGKEAGLVTIDLEDPLKPRKLGALGLSDPRDLLADGDRLYVADGPAGVRIFDIGRTKRPVPLGVLKTADATALAIAWPHLHVADGAGGLLVADVGDPANPTIVSRTPTAKEGAAAGRGSPSRAVGVALLFQPARPDPERGRTAARRLAFVSDAGGAVLAFDATAAEKPLPIARIPFGGFEAPGNAFEPRALATFTRFDLGSERGRVPSSENDYLLAAFEIDSGGARAGYVHVVKVTDPFRPDPVATPNVPAGLSGLSIGHVFNAPFLQTLLFAGTSAGPVVFDLTKPESPAGLALVPGIGRCSNVALEAFSFDRLVDPATGRPAKDVSHAGARFLDPAEIGRLLRAPIGPAGGTTPRAGR